MLSNKIKFIALASLLSASVLTGTAVAGSYTPNLTKASAPTYLRRAHFAVSSGLAPSNLFLGSTDSSAVNKEYEDSFAITITSDETNNAFTVKLNSSKTKFAAANIKSMCLVNIGFVNPNTFTFIVGNQSVGSSLEHAQELHPLYADAAYRVDGKYYLAPAPADPNDPTGGSGDKNGPSAVYFDLSSITGDVTEFTIKADETYLEINKYKGGISFIYGCENR